MNPVLSDILKTQAVQTACGQTILVPLHSHVSQEEGIFLQRMIRETMPKQSIEVGLAYGISALYICEAMAEVDAERHTIIDALQSTHYSGTGLANLKRAGFAPLVQFYEEYSDVCLPRLYRDGQRVQFAFIDGQHTFDYVFVDFYFIDRMLDVGGVVVLDDIYLPSVTKLCRYALTNLKYEAIGPNPTPSSLRLARLVSLAARLGSKINIGRRFIAPEARLPNVMLGIPRPHQYVALRKTGNNAIDYDNTEDRRYDFHKEF